MLILANGVLSDRSGMNQITSFATFEILVEDENSEIVSNLKGIVENEIIKYC